MKDRSQDMSDAAFRAGMAALLALGVFTRTFRLGHKVFWADEGYDFHYANMSTMREMMIALKPSIQGVLPHIIDHYWLKAFGASTAAIHLQTVIWSVITLLLFAQMCARFFPRHVALGAVAVFSLSAFLPEFAQTMRYFALSGLCGQLWLTGFFYFRETRRGRWLALYAAGAALALQIHPYALFTIVSITLFVFLFRRQAGVNPWLVLAANVLASALAFTRVLQYGATGSGALAAAVPLDEAFRHLATLPVRGIARVFLEMCAGRYLTVDDLTLSGAAAVAIAFALVCVAAFFHREQRPVVLFCAWALTLSVLLGWLGMVFRSLYFRSQYFVPLSGLLSITLSLGADVIRRRVPRAGPALLAAYGVLSLAFFTVYWTRMDRPENTKTIIALVERQSRPGDFLNISPPYFFVIEYYWRDALPLHDFSDDFDPATGIHSNLFLVQRAQYQLTQARMESWHEKTASRYKRVWMLWMYGARNTEDDTALARRWMDRHYRRVSVVPFRQMAYASYYTGELVLYEIRPIHRRKK